MQQRILTSARAGFVLTVAFSAIGGYIGLAQHAPELSAMDLIYSDLQLFVLDSAPLAGGGPYPPLLEVARFTAPAATVYALFEGLRAVFADELRRIQTRRRRGHVVVTGATPFADAVAEKMAGEVVHIREPGPISAERLRAAGLAGASALYACADDRVERGANLATALEAATIDRTDARLQVRALVSDPQLAFTARRLGAPGATDVLMDFFNVEDLAARTLVAAEELPDDPHLVIVGLGPFGSALLVELAQQWRARSANRLRLTVVDADATRILDRLMAAHDVIGKVCDLTIVDGEPSDLAVSPWRVYLCYEDEELTLRTALTAVALWKSPGGLVVRLDQLAALGSAFNGAGRARLLDDLDGRLRFVSVTDLACVGITDHDDINERLARAIHERYLMERIIDGTPIGSTVAMAVWDELNEDIKDANRAQAADIGNKLTLIGCTIAPATRESSLFSYRPEELEMLAQHEHRRWMDQRLAAGWTYGEVRDDANKRHNCLVPWEELPESERNKDRDVVRYTPEILADAGLEAVRLS